MPTGQRRPKNKIRPKGKRVPLSKRAGTKSRAKTSHASPSALAGIEPALFRKALGCFATGITVVSAEDAAGKAFGLTVNAFTSVSLEPPLILFCLGRQGRNFKKFMRAKNCTVSILGKDQRTLSAHFAGRGEKYADKNTETEGKNQDVFSELNSSLARLTCRIERRIPAGDHVIFMAKVVAAKLQEGEPLLYIRGHYRRPAADQG